MKPLLYFDTSVFNWLLDDEKANDLVVNLAEGSTVLISVLTASELIANRSEDRRRQLASIAKSLRGQYRPLALPHEILERTFKAFSNGVSDVEMTIDDDHGWAWDLFENSRSITEEHRCQAAVWKRDVESKFRAFHGQGRPKMQEVRTQFGGKGQVFEPRSASALLRYFSDDGRVLTNAVKTLTKKMTTKTLSDNDALDIVDKIEWWRFYLAAWAYSLYISSIQQDRHGRKHTPGSIDVQQAIYLGNCHVFVTNDKPQRRMLRMLAPFGDMTRFIWNHERLRKWAKDGCQEINGLDYKFGLVG